MNVLWSMKVSWRTTGALLAIHLGLASADPVETRETIPLTICGDSSLCTTGATVATITKTQLAANELTFSLSTSSGYAIRFESGNNAFGFNSSVSGLSITNISAGGSVGDTRNISEFGRFDYTIGGTGGANLTTLTFDVVRPTGRLDLADVDVNNNKNFQFVAHVINLSSSVTGFVAGGTPTAPVPETTSIVLFGTALLAAGRWARKRLS